MKKSLKTIIMSGVAAFVFAISGCKLFDKEPTQEELFEEYAAMAKTSIEAEEWYVQVGDRERITVDENGTYIIGRYGDKNFYIKQGDQYIGYSSELNGSGKRLITQEVWEEKHKNYLLTKDEGLGNAFTAKSLADFKNNLKNVLIASGTSLDMNMEIKLNKKDDELTLHISLEYRMVGENDTTDAFFEVVCYDGMVRELMIGEVEGDESYTETHYINYSTNLATVPSAEDLEGFIWEEQ